MRARAAWQFAELNIMKEIGSKNLTWQSLTRSRRPHFLKVRPRGDLCHPYRLNTVMQIYRQLHKAINVQLAKCSIKSNQIKSHHHAIKSTGLFSARLCKSRSDSSHALYRLCAVCLQWGHNKMFCLEKASCEKARTYMYRRRFLSASGRLSIMIL